MANRFYYGDKLIRTSKDHIYTHAAINITTGKCYGCSATRQGAQANIDRIVNGYIEGIENAKAAKKAIEGGKNGYFFKEGRHTGFHRFEKTDTAEKYEKSIAQMKNGMDWYKNNLRVVELEQR